MFGQEDKRPPSAPCYDRQANLPKIPPNAEFPKPFETPGAWSRVYPLPLHACRGLSRNPSQRTKELYIYKTPLLQEFANHRGQVCGQCCVKCHGRMSSFALPVCSLVEWPTPLPGRGRVGTPARSEAAGQQSGLCLKNNSGRTGMEIVNAPDQAYRSHFRGEVVLCK